MTACPPACLHQLLAALPTGEIPATPHAKVLHPSLCELPLHPFACRLTSELLARRIAADASRRPAAPVDHSQGRCAALMPAPSTRQQGLVQHLCFFLPCRHRVRPLRVAWPQPAPTLSSSPSRRRCMDKISTPLCALPAARYCLTTLCAARAHNQSTAALSHHLPLSLLAQVRVAPT
jgi:hypothetical protein